MTTQSASAGISVRPLSPALTIFVVLMCAVWGFNQVAVKLALPDFPPMVQSFVRSVVGALIVGGIGWWRGADFSLRDGTLAAGVVAGVMFGFEFILIYRGLLWTTASRASLFIYMMPILTVIGLRWVTPGDHFSLSQWGGLILAFAGIVIAFGVPTPAVDPRQMLGDLMMLAAAFMWAGTTMVIKGTSLNHASFEKSFLYQLVVSAPMFAVCAWLFDERMVSNPSALAIGSLIYQSVFVVGITFLIWFALIQRYSAAKLSAFTFLTPLFGVLYGHVVLGDPINLAFGIAVICTITGLVLVNRK